MKFNRRQIESYCTYFSYQLALFMGVILLLGLTDNFFDWDIIPFKIQRAIERMVLPGLGIILGGCVGLSLLLNFSLLSSSIEIIATKNESAAEEKFKLKIFGKQILKVIVIIVGGLAILIFALNTYDARRTQSLFDDFKMASADSAHIAKVCSYLNQLNRNEEFLYKEENCESILADDTCLGYTNVITLASVKKMLYNMGEMHDCQFSVYTVFHQQLIRITSDGVEIEGIFVDYEEVMQKLKSRESVIKNETINGLKIYRNDSRIKLHQVIIDLDENGKGKLFVTGESGNN